MGFDQEITDTRIFIPNIGPQTDTETIYRQCEEALVKKGKPVRLGRWLIVSGNFLFKVFQFPEEYRKWSDDMQDMPLNTESRSYPGKLLCRTTCLEVALGYCIGAWNADWT